MSEWKKVRLGEITSIKTGKLNSCDAVEDGCYPFFTCAENPLRINTAAYDSESVLVAGNCTPYVNYYKGKFNAYQRTYIITPTAEDLFGRWLFYWMRQEIKMMIHRQQGSVEKYFVLSDFTEEELTLPPLATQRRIAAVLSSLDDKIENNRKICANLEAQAQAIFKSWFVDFEPFGGKMPQGWKMGKLGDVAECNPYRALKKGVKARCVEMADLVTSASFPASWSYKEYSGGMKFANGDTIIARITPCFENGKSAYANFLEEGEVAFGSTEYVVMASRSVVPPELFYCVAKDPEFISFAKSRMVGSSGRQRFSAEDIAMYPIVIAPDEVYLKVQPLLHSFMDQARTLGFESRALAATRDALLPKLMSGEIDVEKVKVS